MVHGHVTRGIAKPPSVGSRPGVFGSRLSLGQYLGIDVGVDASWLLLAVLITWSLAAGVFPSLYGDLSPTTHWIMGAAGAIGLFVSVIVHELAHAVVAKRYGVEIQGITLFIFGGVAQMRSEPPSPKAEFYVAIAGPIASLLVAVVCFGVGLASAVVAPTSFLGVVGYLASINGILVAFNLLPAFPLDGGRVLRSYLWHKRKDLRWATRVTSAIGGGLGLGLIVLGILTILQGRFVGGMWWALIGMFLRTVARASYEQVVVRQTLENQSLRRFMNPDPVVAPAHISLHSFVQDYLFDSHHRLYPVADDGRLLGAIAVRQVKEVPKDQWAHVKVGDVVEPPTIDNTVPLSADPAEVLGLMRRARASRVLVVDGEELAGIVTLKDLIQFVSISSELDQTPDDGGVRLTH